MATERTLRPAEAGDLGAILELVGGAGLPTEGIAERLPEGYAVVTDGKRVIGVAGVEVHDRWGLLRSVAVSTEARGTGLGMELTRERVRWSEQQGLEALYLLTTTAEGFFPRLGFQATPREAVPEAVRGSQEFRGICPASAAVMALVLPDR